MATTGTRMIDVAEIIHDSRLGNLHLSEERAEYDSIATATDFLFNLLAERKIPYALVGGLAVRHYVAGRNTRDIDLVMAVKDLARLPELTLTMRGPDFGRGSVGGVAVDVLLTRNRFFNLMLKKYGVTIIIARNHVSSLTPEGLILMKLYALPSLSRQGLVQRIGIYENDIAELIRHTSQDPQALLAKLQPYMLATDIAAIEDILVDIAARLARARTNPFANGDPSADLHIP